MTKVYEVGDKVQCKVPTAGLTEGGWYTVERVNGTEQDQRYSVRNDYGLVKTYFDYRFGKEEQLEFDFMEVDYEQLTRDTKMLNEYQQDIEQFIMCEGDARLLENTLGITGEAGEVSEKIKKHVRDGTPLDKDGVIKELGDVLFYVAALATHLDEDLSEVAAINIEKLRDRKARGVIQGSGDCR